MYRAFFNKSYIFKFFLILLLLFIVLSLFFAWEYNKKLKGREFGDVLYKVLLDSNLTQEEQIEHLKKVISSEIEPYASFASMWLADVYYEQNNIEGFLENYRKIIQSPLGETFIKSLAAVKLSLHKSLEGLEMAKGIYYFTSQMLEILNALEDFSAIEDFDALKVKVLNLRDSVAAPKNIKIIAGELAKLYFSDNAVSLDE